MKKQLFIITAVITFLTVLSSPASAQLFKTSKVNVEFDFHVGKTLYPAGAYLIESVSLINDNVLVIKSADGSRNQMLVGSALNARKWQQPKLVFRRYGKSYFLSEIFLRGGEWGFSFPASRKQREQIIPAIKEEVALSR